MRCIGPFERKESVATITEEETLTVKDDETTDSTVRCDDAEILQKNPELIEEERSPRKCPFRKPSL